MIEIDKMHIIKRIIAPYIRYGPTSQFQCAIKDKEDTAWYLYMEQYGHTLDIPYFIRKV